MHHHIVHCRWPAWLLVAAAIAAPQSELAAHDVPDRSFDRALEVVLDADQIRITYHLSLTQLTLAEELLSLVGASGLADAGPAARLERYAAEMAPLVARGLVVEVDGKEIALQVTGMSHHVDDHPRFQFDLAARVAALAQESTLRVEDTNFFLEKGRVRIAMRTFGDSTLEDSTVPSKLADADPRAAWQMTPEQQDAARQASAHWTRRAAIATDSVHTAVPTTDAAATTNQNSSDTGASNRTTSHRTPDLTALLDRWSEGFYAMLLGLAFFFGIAHAMTPGHGKTMVAAYLVGERGTLRHAVGLGLTTSLTHTGSVLAVALLLWLIGPAIEQRIQSGFSLLSGLLVAALGGTLLVLRLRGARRAGSPNPPPHASCGDCSGHALAQSDGPGGTPGWAGLFTLGVSGGIVPCWDAVVLLLIATAQGQVGQAVFLLVSFSAGLATALVLVGVLAVKLRGFLAGRMGSGRIVRALPIFSAAAILAVGLYLCFSTLEKLPAAPVGTSHASNRIIEP